MNSPVRPEHVKIVAGRSKGLGVVCACGCINFNYLDPQDTMWRCRNCGQVLSYDFPRLLEKVAIKQEQAATPGEEAAQQQKVVGSRK